MNFRFSKFTSFEIDNQAEAATLFHIHVHIHLTASYIWYLQRNYKVHFQLKEAKKRRSEREQKNFHFHFVNFGFTARCLSFLFSKFPCQPLKSSIMWLYLFIPMHIFLEPNILKDILKSNKSNIVAFRKTFICLLKFPHFFNRDKRMVFCRK